MFNGILDCSLRDLVEDDAMDRFVLEGAAFLQEFVEMPGDGFTLAIRVGREIEGIGLPEFVCDCLHMFAVAVDDLVIHRKAVLRVDCALLGNEIAHMAIGSKHLEILAEIFLDGFGFGGRLYNDQVHPSCLVCMTVDCRRQ